MPPLSQSPRAGSKDGSLATPSCKTALCKGFPPHLSPHAPRNGLDTLGAMRHAAGGSAMTGGRCRWNLGSLGPSRHPHLETACTGSSSPLHWACHGLQPTRQIPTKENNHLDQIQCLGKKAWTCIAACISAACPLHPDHIQSRTCRPRGKLQTLH